MTLFEQALQQFEEAAYELTRMTPGDKRRPAAQERYDRKRRALIDYAERKS